jgi:hypothetical protein
MLLGPVYVHETLVNDADHERIKPCAFLGCGNDLYRRLRLHGGVVEVEEQLRNAEAIRPKILGHDLVLDILWQSGAHVSIPSAFESSCNL